MEGFIRIHENKNVKLFRVLSGYSIFSICSIIAIVFYYIGLEFQYSISYVIAILCFAFFWQMRLELQFMSKFAKMQMWHYMQRWLTQI